MSKLVRSSTMTTDLVRQELTNAMMNSANLPLVRDNVAALAVLGFSHIQQMKQNGGFRPSSIAQNTRLITRLRG